jgi:hypothetical protein
MVRSRLVALVGLLVAVAGSPASGEGLPEERTRVMTDHNWIAASTTSMSKTGDARLTPTSITFDGRVTYRLHHLREIVQPPRRERGWGDITQFSLYEIVDPRIEAMINGNTLCGHPRYGYTVFPARYLAIGFERSYAGYDLLILTYRTESPPDINIDDGLCGELGYAARDR